MDCDFNTSFLIAVFLCHNVNNNYYYDNNNNNSSNNTKYAANLKRSYNVIV